MKAWVSRINSIIDSLSWFGMLILWVVAILQLLLQSGNREAIGITDIRDCSLLDKLFTSRTSVHYLPVITGVLFFILFTMIIRRNPETVLAHISRYLRLLTVIAACLAIIYY